MSRACDICGKGVMYGNTVSKSKIHRRRTWRPNVHPLKTVIDGTTITLKVCNRCLSRGFVDKKVRVPNTAVESK